ncbi:MAG: hypothetical protein SXG53_28530, partial [Pseudomonadota bacterium]|nr:hypothetical protein [Pseudomonadota bacterium]
MSAFIRSSVALVLLAAAAAQAQQEPTASERAHIPPEPPQQAMRDMSEEEMAEMMGTVSSMPIIS